MPQFISPGLMVGAGIGNALSQGVDTFLKAKQMNQQNNFEKTKLGLMGAKEGYDIDNDTGSITPNAFGQSQQESKIAQNSLLTKQTQQTLQDADAEASGDSDVSKAMRGTASLWASQLQNAPGLKQKLQDPDSLESHAFNDFNALATNPKTSAHTMQRFLQNNAAISDMLAEQKIETGFQRLGLQQGQKFTDKQNQYLTSTQALLEGMRGNPAAQKAENDVYASAKVDSLIKMVGGNLNNISPQMTNLLFSEVGKIASGNQPTLDELKGLDANALPKNFAKVMQKFTNEPSPANAGAFIKEYQDYAGNISQDAKNYIQNRYGRIIEVNKDRLGQDNYNHLKQNYLDRFTNPTGTVGGGAGLMGNPDSQGTQTPPAPKLTPSQRAAIIQQLGGK